MKAIKNLRKSVVLSLVGGASLLAIPMGGCGTAGELFEIGWNIGAELGNMIDEMERESYNSSGVSGGDYFFGF